MSPSNGSGQEPDLPTIFRHDYPPEAEEWAVFWEVDDEDTFELAEGQYETPTDVATEWIAISRSVIVNLSNCR